MERISTSSNNFKSRLENLHNKLFKPTDNSITDSNVKVFLPTQPSSMGWEELAQYIDWYDWSDGIFDWTDDIFYNDWENTIAK